MSFDIHLGQDISGSQEAPGYREEKEGQDESRWSEKAGKKDSDEWNRASPLKFKDKEAGTSLFEGGK